MWRALAALLALPATEARAPGAPDRADPALASGAWIGLLDDDEAVLAAMRQLAEHRGCRVVEGTELVGDGRQNDMLEGGVLGVAVEALMDQLQAALAGRAGGMEVSALELQQGFEDGVPGQRVIATVAQLQDRTGLRSFSLEKLEHLQFNNSRECEPCEELATLLRGLDHAAVQLSDWLGMRYFTHVGDISRQTMAL